jgi:GNAT superfamily N-acetyltransferase
MLDVFYRAMDHLLQSRSRQPVPRNPRLLGALFSHFLATDPASSVVADDHGHLVAFGISYVRETSGFISFLYVLPGWQGQGLGRAILTECFRAMGRLERSATCAEADQPASTGLYVSLGMTPRIPLYLLTGELDVRMLPEIPEDAILTHLKGEDAAALDRDLLGYARPAEHAFWRADERQGWRLTSKQGHPLGYGYVHHSARLGPVAASDPGYLPMLLGHLVRSLQPSGPWQVVVPGPAAAALSALLAAGMRIDGTPAVYCADHEGPRFDRYLPMSFALL